MPAKFHNCRVINEFVKAVETEAVEIVVNAYDLFGFGGLAFGVHFYVLKIIILKVWHVMLDEFFRIDKGP